MTTVRNHRLAKAILQNIKERQAVTWPLVHDFWTQPRSFVRIRLMSMEMLPRSSQPLSGNLQQTYCKPVD